MALISPNDIKISGYVNNYKTGNVLTFHEDIPPFNGSEYIPQASGNSDKVFWGWAEFEVEEGHTYCLFNQNTQLDFGGFSFTPDKTSGIRSINATEPSNDTCRYNILDRKVTDTHKGLSYCLVKGSSLTGE